MGGGKTHLIVGFGLLANATPYCASQYCRGLFLCPGF